MHFALLVPAVILCALSPQEQNYEEYELTKFRARGAGNHWNVDMILQHQFPKGALISIVAKQRKHKFNWESKGFFFGINPYDTGSTLVNCEAANRTLRTRNLTVPTPGMYEFWFWFDPNAQSRGRQLRRQMGERNWFRYDLAPLSRTIGEPDKMLSALRQDTTKCAKMIDRATKLMDRIEKESDDKDWKEKAEGIFNEIGEMKNEAEEQKDSSLHNAAYQVVTELLAELVIVGTMIKQLQAEAGGAEGGFSGAGDDDEPDTTHPEDGGSTPIVGGADGKKLSVSKMKKHLALADVARLREFYSWITLLHKEGLDHLWKAYQAAKKNLKDQKGFRGQRIALRSTNSQLEKSFTFVLSKKSWKTKLEPWTQYKIGEEEARYSDFFEQLNRFMGLLTEDAVTAGAIPQRITEAYEEITKHLSTARTRVMGKF